MMVLLAPICNKFDDMITRTEAQDVYTCYRFTINASHDVNAKLEHIFNFPVQGDVNLLEAVQNQIRNVFQQHNVSFRLNFAARMILQNIK